MNLLNKAGLRVTIASAFLSALLAGCGGGGTAKPAASVSGVAATGAAIASGTVTLRCASGTANAVATGADGGFTLDMGAVTLPCVARVDYKDGTGAAQKLHSFISAIGTANITPVTELLVANLTGGTAADAFDKFDAAKAKGYTAAQVKAAAAAVKTYLKNTLGVDTTNLPDDPLGNKFIAKAGAVLGDAFDKMLDDLQAKLTAGGKKLSDAVSDVGKAGAAATGGTGGGTGGGSSSDGPTVDKAKLALLCPNAVSSIAYTKCKASLDASVNGVMIDINIWMAANARNLKVSSADAGLGVAVGDTCTFGLEPGLGLWLVTFKGGSVSANPGIAFNGANGDAVELTTGGQIGYVSAGDDFAVGNGKMEINFPGFTQGSPTELVYGKGGKILICKPS